MNIKSGPLYNLYNRNRKITATLFVSLGVILLTVLEDVRINHIEEQSCKDTLQQVAEQTVGEIERHIYSDQELLESMANIIAGQDSVDSQEVQDIIDAFEPLTWIDHVALLLPGDKVMLPGEAVRDVKGILSFEEHAALGKHVSDRCTDIREKDSLILRNFVPVVKDGKTIAMLYGVVNLDTLPNQFRINIYGSQAAMYIIDRKTGDFIIDTWHGSPGNVQELRERKSKDGNTMSQHNRYVMSGESGYAAFASETAGEYLYIYYEPLSINDWSVGISVAESVAFRRLHRTQKLLLAFGTAEVFLLFVYFCWILHNVRTEVHEKQAQIELIHSIYEIENLLFSAHLKPENVPLALEKVAQMASADAAFFVIYPTSEPDQIFCWSRQEEDANPLLKKLRDNRFYRDNIKNGECMLADNTLIFPISNIDNKIIGVLGCLNAHHKWHHIQMFENVKMSFAMFSNNMENYHMIRMFGETDVLTDLLNRNCYEKELANYPSRCSQSLICIYADANGLHELNNTQGHAAGDKMLQTVAHAMQHAFGNKDTYRIGGDEFVAFVIDRDITGVQDKIHKINELLQEMTYHVSFGIHMQEIPIDMDQLIKQAEKRMYEAKSNFYSQKGRDRRRRSADR